MPDINDAKGSDLLKYGLFGATGYDTNNKLVGYGVGFGTQKYIYVLGKDFVQGINNRTIYAEKIYKTNFIEQSKNVVI